MSYSGSIQDGRLRELYAFTTDGGTRRYTSGANDVVAMNETWPALPISRTEIDQTAELARSSITLTFPRTDEFALQLIDPFGVDGRMSLTMWSEDDFDDWAVSWKGRVIGASLSGSTISVECESVITSSRRLGLPARVTRSCVHAVYHRGCNLDKADWAVWSIVEAIDGLTLTIPAASEQPDGWYIGGMIEFGGVFRWIVGHVGDQITILRPLRGLVEDLENSGYGLNYGLDYGGLAVKIYPGCDRTKETCDAKFDNLLNRLGFDWLPERNPFDGSSIL